MKRTREEVYALIDQERAYQTKWDLTNYPGRVKDADKEVESWLSSMRVYLRKSEEAALSVDKTEALENIRKVLGLGVACLEHHGGPSREQPVI